MLEEALEKVLEKTLELVPEKALELIPDKELETQRDYTPLLTELYTMSTL